MNKNFESMAYNAMHAEDMPMCQFESYQKMELALYLRPIAFEDYMASITKSVEKGLITKEKGNELYKKAKIYCRDCKGR